MKLQISRRLLALLFATMYVCPFLTASVQAQDLDADKKWVDLPIKEAAFRRLQLGKFLGDEEEGYDKVAKRLYSGKEVDFLPNGAMVSEKPTLKDRADGAIGKWFGRVYKEQDVRNRGTLVKSGRRVYIYARGPELAPKNLVEVKSFRKTGNLIQVQLGTIVNQGGSTMLGGPPWWPLLELPLDKLSPGAYAVEVIWRDTQGSFEWVHRQVAAFAVVDDGEKPQSGSDRVPKKAESEPPQMPSAARKPPTLRNLPADATEFIYNPFFLYELTDKDLMGIKRLKKLKTLYLAGTSITNTGLGELAGMASLQELALSGTQITDTGLKHLGGLSKLRSLYLINTQVSGVGIAHLQKLTELSHLDLSWCPLTVKGIQELKKLRGLRTLVMSDHQFCDERINALSQVTGLTTLDLSHTNVTDADLKKLASLAALESFRLYDTKVTDSGLLELRMLKELRSLELDANAITDEGLKVLSTFAKLELLWLNDCPITNQGITALPNLKNLRELSLSGTKITDDALVAISKLPKLRRLYLENTEITDVGVKRLAELKCLESLDLQGTSITDSSVEVLGAMRALGSLKVSSTRITSNGKKELNRLLPNCFFWY